jgi:hypothetical protein
MHIRLRKKDYDFTLADAACNLSFDILRQREGTTKKDGDVEPLDDNCTVEADMKDVANGNDVTHTKDEENGCDAMLGKENLNGEPCAKKQKLGPVSDKDLIPLKPKVSRCVLFCNRGSFRSGLRFVKK